MKEKELVFFLIKKVSVFMSESKKKKSTANWFLLACSLFYLYPLSFIVIFIPNT
jgi:hypothetical protein